MTIDKFKEILSRPEGPTLDFKKEQYDLLFDKEGINTARFIKDIISFANTIRDETAYIIIGIEENDGIKNIIGLDKFLDDSIFQDKIKDKVSPRPKFYYYSIDFNEQRFGIIEIPIVKYSEPICPIKNLKGLEIGKVYFRRGSMNAEATIKEVIEINDWFRSIKTALNISELTSKITDIITYLNTDDSKLSKGLSDTLKLAYEIDDKELIIFCKGELMGWDYKTLDQVNIEPEEFLSHRKSEQIISPYKLSLRPTSATTNEIWEFIKNYDHSVERTVLSKESVSTLEESLTEFKRLDFKAISVKESSFQSSELNTKDNDRTIYIYSNYKITKDLYLKCKQRLLEELIDRIK